jgi:amino acid adenylation domain-containing protein
MSTNLRNIYHFRPSRSQRSLWLAHQRNVDAGTYNLSTAWRLRGSLDQIALESALNDVVVRHEVLRTNFLQDETGLVQQVWSQMPVKIPLIEVACDGGDAFATSLAHVHKEAQQPFDLGGDPLVRAHLFRIDRDDHVFILTFHHIVTDGWSMDILWDELGQAYASNRVNVRWTPAELPFQYADYSEWQHDWLESEQARLGLNYWTQYLAGACPTIALPCIGADSNGGARQYHGESICFTLASVHANGLAEIARRHRTTLFVTLFAALHVLLHRLSQQDDLSVGYAVANRRQAETHPLIGCFINTLVLRTRPHPEQTFDAFVESVRESVLQGEVYQETPFEQVVEELRPDRTADGTSLFQVMFGFREQSRSGLPFTLSGLAIEAVPLNLTATKFDLNVDIVHAPSGLVVVFQFDKGLCDREAVERMTAHFESLLISIVHAPQSELWRLALTRPGQVLPMSMATNPVEPAGATIETLLPAFEAQVRRTPQATAVIAEDGHWTYAQLNRRANQIAAYLRQQLLARESIVAVLMERKGDLIAALLGIMKAGGAYLPLDTTFPHERMRRMLAQADAAAVLTTRNLSTYLHDSPTPIVYLDKESAVIAECGDADLDLPILRGQLAYCLFTSGSTGQPKGVLIEHHALANLLWAMSREPGVAAGDVWLSVTSPTFDIFGLEIYLPLVSGATVVLANRADASDPVALGELARKHGVTAMQATPATWRMLVESDSPLRLRAALCGGESMDRGLANHLQTMAEEVWNVYGPTETTIWSTRWRVRGTNSPVLGNPIENTDVLVLDTHLNLLPVGVAGEIYIAGHGLARGYVNQLGLTAERFLPNPFGAPGSRMYRTGDLGYMNANGALVYLNRGDFQVKIRGFRIELEEIEESLRQCSQVRDAVVVVAGNDMSNRRLVAYVVARNEETQAVCDAIARQLRDALPTYMLPSQLQFIHELPLNVNGKIDRKALPPPERIAPASHARSPSTPTEIRVAGIWASALRIECVLADDNFFALGGNSMLAMRCLARINDAFAVGAKAHLVFKHQTVAALAEAIDYGEALHGAQAIRMTSWFTHPARPRLYGFPAAGMYGGAYFQLASALAPQIDLCMLDPLEFDDQGPMPATVDELADLYARAVSAHDVWTPICLLGHSFGGSVAFETARRLERRGLKVHLILLDSTLINPLELASEWGNSIDEDTSAPSTYSESMRSVTGDSELQRLLVSARTLHAQHWGMLTRYIPSGLFGGDLFALFAQDGRLKHYFEANILTRCRDLVTGQLRTTSTPGDHMSMIQAEHAEQLATLIKGELERQWPQFAASLALL